MVIEFWVEGTPIPQGSKQGFIRGSRVVLVEAGGKRHKDWRAHVASIATQKAAEEDWELVDEPVAVTLDFLLPKPKSKGKKVTMASTKPDLDKLVRAVLDSITGNIIKDDSRVVDIAASKRYAKEAPGVHVIVTVLEDKEPTLFDELNPSN